MSFINKALEKAKSLRHQTVKPDSAPGQAPHPYAGFSMEQLHKASSADTQKAIDEIGDPKVVLSPVKTEWKGAEKPSKAQAFPKVPYKLGEEIAG